MSQSKPKPQPAAEAAAAAEGLDETIAYLAKRHRVSLAIVREISRRSGLTERRALGREIERDGARR